MRKLLMFSSAVLLISGLSQAQANEPRWPRWYVGLSGGVTFLRDSDIKGATTGKVDYSTGGFGTVSLGYLPPFTFQPLSALRFEAELGYHYSSLDSLHSGGVTTDLSGKTHSVSYMGNAYYDVHTGSAWTPYIGGGAGGARVSLSQNALGNTDDTDSVFAYQFMGGLAYAPETMPMTEWSLGYRYFVERDPSFNTASGKLKLGDLTSHNIELGARFRF